MTILQELLVKDVMTTSVITISEDEPITRAADKMLKSRVHGLVVMGRGGPVGLISTYDLLKIVFLKEYSDTVPVKSFASKKDLVTVTPDDVLNEAAHLMVENNIRTLPVVSGGQLAGIVSMMDIMKKVLA
jgi:CBS domain-containing protein